MLPRSKRGWRTGGGARRVHSAKGVRIRGSDAEDKDGVQVGEQVPLRGQNGEEEAGEGETGEVGDENIYCAGIVLSIEY